MEQCSSDTELVLKSKAGDRISFDLLVRRYESLITSVIRRYIRGTHDAEDIYQDALIQAWTGMKSLREPEHVSTWFAQIARNRCRDFLGAAARRVGTTAPEEIDSLDLLLGQFQNVPDGRLREILDAIAQTPRLNRDITRMFYIDGFTVAEIAEREGFAEGTVKRRLHETRNFVRTALGVDRKKHGEYTMTRHRTGTQNQPFPMRRPDIAIKKSEIAIVDVDCREYRWLFVTPEIGEHSAWATYDAPNWRLTGVYDSAVTCRARIHDLEGVEIAGDYWEKESGWQPAANLWYVRLTENTIEPIAAAYVSNNTRVLNTYLDDEFVNRWGDSKPRRLRDTGRFAQRPDGTYTYEPGEPGCIGAGVFDVTIGQNKETCLRVIDIEDLADDGLLMEAYVTRDGRTLLARRYNGRLWQSNRRGVWDEKLPNSSQLVINDVTFVHWYDCLPAWALGITA